MITIWSRANRAMLFPHLTSAFSGSTGRNFVLPGSGLHVKGGRSLVLMMGLEFCTLAKGRRISVYELADTPRQEDGILLPASYLQYQGSWAAPGLKWHPKVNTSLRIKVGFDCAIVSEGGRGLETVDREKMRWQFTADGFDPQAGLRGDDDI